MNANDIKNAFAPWKNEEKPLPPVSVEAAAAPAPVTAKLNYSQVGVCIYCSKPMKKTLACEQEVYLCMDDRFVSPLPNSELL